MVLIDVVMGGFTIHVEDFVDSKLTALLHLSSCCTNPHRHALVQPLTLPPFLSVNVASSL